jgi:hypothetical protein
MKYFTHWLTYRLTIPATTTPEQIAAWPAWEEAQRELHDRGINIKEAILLHFKTYYKTMTDINNWTRAGMDWWLCATGEYFDVTDDYVHAEFYSILQLGKLVIHREECVHLEIIDGDLKDSYVYTIPDYPVNSFSRLIITPDQNPFNSVNGIRLYPEKITLTDYYRAAALAFATKDIFSFQSLFETRPYIFLLIITIIDQAVKWKVNSFIFLTDSLMKKEYPGFKGDFDQIDEVVNTILPSVYSFELSSYSETEKWYFRALGKFKQYELETGQTIMSMFPWDNIGTKIEILTTSNLIIGA